ncbi:DUF4153 domain-containing protein [Virgibacillus oceani]
MEIQVRQKDWLFLLVCLGLGLLGELSFFHGRIGMSYLVFIAGFYLVLFLRFRFVFHHRRIGLLLMIAIWILAGSYLFYDSVLFYQLNLLIIPVLVFFHIVLITTPNQLNWSRPHFILLLTAKLRQGLQYVSSFCRLSLQKVFKNMTDQRAKTIKHILIGLAIGVPLLLIITGLLMSADAVFQDVVLRLPAFVLQLHFIEGVFRVAVVVFLAFLFFGIFQVLHRSSEVEEQLNQERRNIHWDSVIAITILVMLNAIYVLFAAIQFTYFFSNGLQDGFTYAEYARRGFFELLFVTVINWTLLICFLKLVNDSRKGIKMTLKIMYSLLIIVSGVMLVSAYQRLSMYQAAYGYTLDRILADGFMIFLMVVFAYTFIRVWIERLSLLHFYLIAGLAFYTVLNAIHIEQIIVDNNLERYEETGKIDVHYLNSLSYTGLEGLMELYEKEPDYPALEDILQERQTYMEKQETWHSYNFTREAVTKRLQELEF